MISDSIRWLNQCWIFYLNLENLRLIHQNKRIIFLIQKITGINIKLTGTFIENIRRMLH